MTQTMWIIVEIFLGIGFLVVLTAVSTLVTQRLQGRAKGPEQILQERYARGELTREQYEQMRQDLGIPAGAGEGMRARETAGRGVG